MEPESPLGAVEVRVLGSLVEKDLTTPDYYPMTLNALTLACNQSSNRDPVVAYGEQAVARGLDALRERKLAFVFQGAESRVPKFGHRLVETLELTRPQMAVLCVLMLRGAQTLGEIRARTGRMHEFGTLGDAETVLSELAARAPSALAVKLPRQAGMKEQRFAHLLAGAVAVPEPASAPEIPVTSAPEGNERVDRLERETAALRTEVADLRRQFEAFRKQLE